MSVFRVGPLELTLKFARRGVDAGTENVIAACNQVGVGRLVYTSTSDVIFDGSAKEGVDETAALASRPSPYNSYISTKGMVSTRKYAVIGCATSPWQPHGY
jgi:UDP-glucose 4-epimerase